MKNIVCWVFLQLAIDLHVIVIVGESVAFRTIMKGLLRGDQRGSLAGSVLDEISKTLVKGSRK